MALATLSPIMDETTESISAELVLSEAVELAVFWSSTALA
jgi:hypothetical protein